MSPVFPSSVPICTERECCGRLPSPAEIIGTAAKSTGRFKIRVLLWLVDDFPRTFGPNGTNIRRASCEMARECFRLSAEHRIDEGHMGDADRSRWSGVAIRARSASTSDRSPVVQGRTAAVGMHSIGGGRLR